MWLNSCLVEKNIVPLSLVWISFVSMYKLLSYIVFLMVFLSSCITEEEMEGYELIVGDKVPAFSVKMENGETVTAEDLKGRVSLIVFFHT